MGQNVVHNHGNAIVVKRSASGVAVGGGIDGAAETGTKAWRVSKLLCVASIP